jgi:hypothetical protein
MAVVVDVVVDGMVVVYKFVVVVMVLDFHIQVDYRYSN